MDRQSYSRRLLSLIKDAFTSLFISTALGRRQTQYIIFSISQSPVFLVNSRSSLLSSSAYVPVSRTLSPEVTESFCRVPSILFLQSPWYSLPIHRCQFRVRFFYSRRLFLNPIRLHEVLFFFIKPFLVSSFVLPIDLNFGFDLRDRLIRSWLILYCDPLDFRRQCLLYCFSLLISTYIILISPKNVPHSSTPKYRTFCYPILLP